MDIASRIHQIEEVVREAKGMPLSASVLVNREEMLQLLSDLREAVPEEIKQARWVVRDREELLAKARRDAEALVEKARAEQVRMARREEIALKAEEEAERILAEAREEARRMRLEAEDYVDARLAQFEAALHKAHELLAQAEAAVARTMEQVERGRERLRGPMHPAEALARPEEDEG